MHTTSFLPWWGERPSRSPNRLISVMETSAPIRDALRTAEFWGRATNIYFAYKTAQLHAVLLQLQGKPDDLIKREVWDKQHAWAGEKMHALCVSLRGFYLKVGRLQPARAAAPTQGASATRESGKLHIFLMLHACALLDCIAWGFN